MLTLVPNTFFCFLLFFVFCFFSRVLALAADRRRSDSFRPRTLRGPNWNLRRKLTTAIRLSFPRSSSSRMRWSHFRHVCQTFCPHKCHFTLPTFLSGWRFSDCRFLKQANTQREARGPRRPGCLGWLYPPAENSGACRRHVRLVLLCNVNIVVLCLFVNVTVWLHVGLHIHTSMNWTISPYQKGYCPSRSLR